MKVGIYGGEAFPIYEVYSSWDSSNIEVSPEVLNKWKEAFNTFAQVQQEIIEAMESQGLKDKVWPNTWGGFHLIDKEALDERETQ